MRFIGNFSGLLFMTIGAALYKVYSNAKLTDDSAPAPEGSETSKAASKASR